MSSERTPLLRGEGSHSYQSYLDDSHDPHDQFCALVGVPSSSLPPGAKEPKPRPTSLYKRATRERRRQNLTYMVTASLSNTLLLTQVVLGATLTALGASESSHVLITIFGVVNTVIAGVVAYLKSRGQPMRARMYRDDMDRVVDELENSEVMWLGISRGVQGYEELTTADGGHVTVRSEVARLTRLYDRAVKTNTMNNPDIYVPGGGLDGPQPARPLLTQQPAAAPVSVPPAVSVVDAPPATAPPVPVAPAAVVVVAAPDPDESPATKAPLPLPPKATSGETSKEDKKGSSAAAPSSSPKPDKKPDQHDDEPPADSTEDSTQTDPSAASKPTPTPAPAPAPASDDILDDPNNPTIDNELKKKETTAPNGPPT